MIQKVFPQSRVSPLSVLIIIISDKFNSRVKLSKNNTIKTYQQLQEIIEHVLFYLLVKIYVVLKLIYEINIIFWRGKIRVRMSVSIGVSFLSVFNPSLAYS